MHLGSVSAARRVAASAPVTYVIFDLLWLDGHSLMALAYEERRARLAELGLQGERWQTPEHVVGHGAALLAASEEQGLEGIVAKRLDSPYEPGRRSACWVKVKNVERDEFVVGGWMPGEGRRRERIGALLVGERDEHGRLRYVGRVGTGFTEEELDRLAARLGPLERDTSPFDGGGTKPPKGAVFVEPRFWPRSSSASGRRTASCARRPTRGCGRTPRRPSSSRRTRRAARGARRRARAPPLEPRQGPVSEPPGSPRAT